jgi:hypothetical protein
MADNLAVLATQAIANVVKSSFGPSGLDKMMVDDIGVSALHVLLTSTLISAGRYGHQRWSYYSQFARC